MKFGAFLLSILLLVSATNHVSSSCQNKYVISRGLTCKEKQSIVHLHNRLRQSVALGQVRGQPSASMMMLLTWDDELARKAQELADTCKYGHDSSGSRAVSRFQVGQNIATRWTTWQETEAPDFAPQIKAWFNEVYQYRFNSGFSHETGHYSQMVWSDTYLVGCGYSHYYDGYKYNKYYVCNYGPTGNVYGKPPYRPGYPSCDSHGMSTSASYYGLCDSSSGYNNLDFCF